MLLLILPGHLRVPTKPIWSNLHPKAPTPFSSIQFQDDYNTFLDDWQYLFSSLSCTIPYITVQWHITRTFVNVRFIIIFFFYFFFLGMEFFSKRLYDFNRLFLKFEHSIFQRDSIPWILGKQFHSIMFGITTTWEMTKGWDGFWHGLYNYWLTTKLFF